MQFEKWQALGNDYLIVERDELPFAITAARVRMLCDRHLGIGSDGLLVLSRPEDRDSSRQSAEGARAQGDAQQDARVHGALQEGTRAQGDPQGGDRAEGARTGEGRRGDAQRPVARLQIFNPDGSSAELSGNGARQALLYLRRRGWVAEDSFTIETDAGLISAQIIDASTCRVHMGRASLTSKDHPGGRESGLGSVHSGGRDWAFRHVSIGNPQCAIEVADPQSLEQLDLAAIGPAIEGSEMFPNRTNVSWYAQLGGGVEGRRAPGGARDEPAAIRARIFERGVGETLSSGTGAIGAAIAHLLGTGQLRQSSSRHAVRVILGGGELLVEVDGDLDVHLTGWARPVFAGRLSEDLIEELNETK